MIEYIHIHHAYRSATMLAVRVLIGFFLLYLVVLGFAGGVFPKVALFFLQMLIMAELFMHFKVGKVKPRKTIAANTTSPEDSFSGSLLTAWTLQKTTASLLRALFRQNNVRFVLGKANILPSEVEVLDIDRHELSRYVFEIAKKLHGTYVTSMDIVIAYLLLVEEQTKLLFKKEIKPEEIMHILYWGRLEYTDEEAPKQFRVHMFGEGIGESLTTGWTPETQAFTTDWTMKGSKRPILFGRHEEYKKMTEALLKKESNNVLLVGDIGVGKENLIFQLIYDSFAGKIDKKLNRKHILELMLGPLIAGATDRGSLETRLQAVIEEVSHAGNIILYIPQFENVLGGTSFNLNISGALLPYLQSGNLPIIATMTTGSYKSYMEQNPLQEVFEVVKLEEPARDIATQMLLEKAKDIETKNGVLLTYKAVVTAVDFADRYLQDTVLPGSAVELLDDVANAVALATSHEKVKLVQASDVVKRVEEKTNIAIGAPKDKEKDLLLHLEDRLHERIVNQVDAVHVIGEAMRRIRTGLAATNKPISFLFLGPTGVGKTETAKGLARLYFGGEDKMVRLDMSEYADQDGIKRLLGAPPGQGDERGELTDKIHDHPFSLILLDEFEKAHPKILDLFLQVFEDGRLTDNKGRTVSFVNALIIATSNAGSEFIRQEVGKGVIIDKQFEQHLLDMLQTQHLFHPELLNRFDDIVTFKPLGEKEIGEIAKLLMQSVVKKLSEQDITLVFDDLLVAKVVKEGYDQQFGARPLRRYIQDNIEDLIAQKKLQDQIKRGSNVLVSTDTGNNLQLTINN
ncbi:MAG: ATP-dependent Clp protease ATP-binding subunit [Candidatus Levybacteria bacterium]|nr:ATP-dependent Clp protease ATP-binding subunit [Candidatus Levybacteria bacterium]